jgi:erythromycin esterase
MVNQSQIFILLIIGIIFTTCQKPKDNILNSEPKPIMLNIISPANDSHFSYGDDILFNLEVKNNPQDVSGVFWTSSEDSIFGSTNNFMYDDLQLGQHSITAIVFFADDSSIDTSLTITIHKRNENAIVQIIPPKLDSLWFYDTDRYVFSAQIKDSAGSNLSTKSIQWISDFDGLISTTHSMTTDQLSVNRHYLSLKVTFTDETISSDSISNILVISDPWAYTDLLNNRQLESPNDIRSPFVRDEWKNWIKQNSIPVRSLVSKDFSDLSFLDPLIKNKNIIQMGEVAHGIAEQNRGRVRLIKYLHQQHNFSVIAFESGFYDCYYTNINMDSLSARDALRASLYGMWHTTDLRDLYNYIKSTQQTANPLYLCGIDIRPTGSSCYTRPEFFKNIISKVDKNFAEVIATQDSMLVQWLTDRPLVDNYIISNFSTLTEDYDALITFLTENHDLLRKEFDQQTLQIALQSAISIRVNLDQRNTSLFESRHRSLIRDQQMYNHFKYLKETQYPDQKIIVWAHNYHIQNDPEPVGYVKTFGYWLHQNYPDELYTIWSLSYRGTINYGVIDEIRITKPESIEAILYYGRKKYFFIDISHQVQNDANSWMFNLISQKYLHSTGEYEIKYIPRDQFDAIFFIDTVSEPIYIY